MVFPYLPAYTSQHINLLHHTNELNVAQRILSNVLKCSRSSHVRAFLPTELEASVLESVFLRTIFY